MSAELKGKRNDLIWGIILVGIGLLALADQFINIHWGNWGVLFLPALGGGFLLWGILSRQAGLIIPGGIISGIGWGAALITGPLSNLDGDYEGGIFMLTFALGWALITLLTAVFTSKTHWWPLIPGGIMALIGGGILFGGIFLQTLTFIGKIWPVFLILLGIYVLYQGTRSGKVQD
jgi:hypothetical protein